MELRKGKVMMQEKIKYFIAYYGGKAPKAWDADKSRFIPYDMHLYITYYDNLDDVFREMRKVRKLASGWRDEIYIDSRLSYSYE